MRLKRTPYVWKSPLLAMAVAFLFHPGICKAKASATEQLNNLRTEKHHGDLLNILDLTFKQNYADARAALESSLPHQLPEYHYFKGLVECALFNDLGDTSALSLAENHWKTLTGLKPIEDKKSPETARLQVYRGLAHLQLSYAASVKKKYVESFLQAKKGTGLLNKHRSYVEAMNSLKIYDYYKQELIRYIEWLPFVEADKEGPQKYLLEHYGESPYLSALFLTPLIWMQFDLGRYQKGLQLTRGFLGQFPENRVFKLMEADFSYKLKQYDRAAALFERAIGFYKTRAEEQPCSQCIPINYWSAVGNLVRVYAATGRTEGFEVNRRIWFSKEVQANEKWLPKSLFKDLERFAPK